MLFMFLGYLSTIAPKVSGVVLPLKACPSQTHWPRGLFAFGEFRKERVSKENDGETKKVMEFPTGRRGLSTGKSGQKLHHCPRGVFNLYHNVVD